MNERLVAVGVDGARAGWVAACLFAAASGQVRTELRLLAAIGEIAALRAAAGAHAGASLPVAIDIPIGLPDGAVPRACDIQARQLLGPRRSSVFAAPARWMLEFEGDYAGLRARVADRRADGEVLASLSAQAHGILPKIAEVDRWLAAHPDADGWLLECHPEVSFMALHGGEPMPAPKKTAEGLQQRRSALTQVFPDAAEQLDGAARRWRRAQVAIDDLHDAYACLHSALATHDVHRVLGDGHRDARGRPMRMVAGLPVASNDSASLLPVLR